MELKKNESTTNNPTDKSETLGDLAVDDRQAEETKGGGHVKVFSGKLTQI